ncbi:MAG TPA: glycosyltransferase 87 family protein [Candidatus Dormibacteraeota bacterium]|nr:glycosyltransferase 87 family protein [Candidatus Dormibacteraeota bacterium]
MSRPAAAILPMLATVRRWPWSRERAAVLGLVLAGLGLSHRLAFVVTRSGAAALIAGVAILGAVALVRNWPAPSSSDEELNLLLTGALLLFAAVGALRPYKYDVAASGLTIAAAVVFLLLEPIKPLRGRRLWIATPLLLAAHAALILDLSFPKQDVFRFLTLGVDGLFHHGLNPYLPIPDPVSADVRPYTFTYPPGALLLVAPFRILLGDIRWAYVVAEGVFVAAVAVMARRGGELKPWQQAVILLPLVFPRTNQAFYDFGNHEWLLLALAASALALRRHWFWSGILLGVALATKQYFVVFPLVFLLPWVDRRALLTAAVTAALIVLPFAAWDAGRMLHDTTNQLGAAPDPERLTVYAMMRGAGLDVGRPGATALAAVGLLLAAGCAWFGRHRLDRALIACGVGLAVFTLCADFAAYNYYGYALALVAWGMAISEGDEGQQPGRHPGVVRVPG